MTDREDDPEASAASLADHLPTRARRPQGVPWTRALLATAMVGPALYFGGTRAETVVAFSFVAVVIWLRVIARSRAALEVPYVALAGALVVGLTLLQWAPIPGLREAAAPQIAAQVSAALEGTDIVARPGLSISPADTGLEVGRLVGLLALFVAAAQLSWRTTATFAAVAGSAVALLGFVHAVFGLNAIYGVYEAHDVDLAAMPSLLTSFVNPNHQSSLLLLGLFCAGALALDHHTRGLRTHEPAKVDRYGDRMLAALAAVSVQLPALVLSLSRAAIVTMLLLAPIAAWLTLRGDPRHRARRHRLRRMSTLRWLGLAAMGLLMLLVARHGAWRELMTLGDLTNPQGQPNDKLRIIGEALGLIGQSPWLGCGRGTFIDLFGPVDSAPSHVLYTHIESAPVAVVVEWGILGGSVAILASLVWLVGAWRRDPGRADTAARRIAILGVVAVGLHNAIDFSWEFLGVAAPWVAVAGGLSSNRRLRWSRRGAAVSMTGALLMGTYLSCVCYRGTFALRDEVDRKVLAGEADPADVAAARPLDGRLHRQLARMAIARGDIELAEHHARIATQLRPGAIDGWLLLAATQDAQGRPQQAADATARALAQLHAIPDAELSSWLVRTFPSPADLVAVAPEDPQTWNRLMHALVVHAPRHADALAAARPSDPAALRFRFDRALASGNAALALHHARLWRSVAPQQGGSHRAVALALRMFDPPRLEQGREALEAGLETEGLDDPAPVEEELLRTLIFLADPAWRPRADEVARNLLRRPGDRPTQIRRAALVEELRRSQPADRYP